MAAVLDLMKSVKWTPFLALASLALGPQDTSPLRRELKPEATETYKVQRQDKVLIDTPNGQLDMVTIIEATVDLRTSNVDAEKGTAAADTTTKIEKYQMSGELADRIGGTPVKLPEPKKETGTITARNLLSLPAMKPLPNASRAELLGAKNLLALIELPEKPFKVGDSIEISTPGSIRTEGLKTSKGTLKIVGEKEVEGRSVWEVTYSGEYKLDIDPAKTTISSTGNVKVLGIYEDGAFSGEALIDKATGKTVSNKMTTKRNRKMELDGGLHAGDNDITEVTSLKLVK